jgi:hypothetical protein
MEALQSSLIPNLLFPYRDIGAVISNIWILWGKRGSEDYKGRLLRLEIGLVGCARPLAGHGKT